MGRLSGQVTAAGRTANESASGFGDPMVELSIKDLIGPKAQKDIPANLRFQPGFSVDLIADLAFSIGTYNSSQPLNIGLNRWYGRLGAPIVAQLGSWVPGQRTTLEFLPAVWLFGPNNNFVGQTLKTDPMFQLDAHLTRDFTQNLWGSLDAVYYNHGASGINGVAGKQLNTWESASRSATRSTTTWVRSLRLQVKLEQRQRPERLAHGQLHDVARVRVAPAGRGYETAPRASSRPPAGRVGPWCAMEINERCEMASSGKRNKTQAAPQPALL